MKRLYLYSESLNAYAIVSDVDRGAFIESGFVEADKFVLPPGHSCIPMFKGWQENYIKCIVDSEIKDVLIKNDFVDDVVKLKKRVQKPNDASQNHSGRRTKAMQRKLKHPDS